ncbi:unnamed protein product, partial [marine sediment metagenome]
LTIHEKFADKRGKCTHCGEPITVPAAFPDDTVPFAQQPTTPDVLPNSQFNHWLVFGVIGALVVMLLLIVPYFFSNGSTEEESSKMIQVTQESGSQTSPERFQDREAAANVTVDEATDMPPDGFREQESHLDGCENRPPGTVCLKFDDGYIWIIRGSVLGWEDRTVNGKTVQVAIGTGGMEYEYMLDTDWVRELSNNPIASSVNVPRSDPSARPGPTSPRAPDNRNIVPSTPSAVSADDVIIPDFIKMKISGVAEIKSFTHKKIRTPGHKWTFEEGRDRRFFMGLGVSMVESARVG